jgi:hypothetical protein
MVGISYLDKPEPSSTIQDAYNHLEGISRRNMETRLPLRNSNSHNPLSEHKRSKQRRGYAQTQEAIHDHSPCTFESTSQRRHALHSLSGIVQNKGTKNHPSRSYHKPAICWTTITDSKSSIWSSEGETHESPWRGTEDCRYLARLRSQTSCDTHRHTH